MPQNPLSTNFLPFASGAMGVAICTMVIFLAIWARGPGRKSLLSRCLYSLLASRSICKFLGLSCIPPSIFPGDSCLGVFLFFRHIPSFPPRSSTPSSPSFSPPSPLPSFPETQANPLPRPAGKRLLLASPRRLPPGRRQASHPRSGPLPHRSISDRLLSRRRG